MGPILRQVARGAVDAEVILRTILPSLQAIVTIVQVQEDLSLMLAFCWHLARASEKQCGHLSWSPFLMSGMLLLWCPTRTGQAMGEGEVWTFASFQYARKGHQQAQTLSA